MRKLESMIAQFVGDLLRTIGEASVEDLRELFEGRPAGEKLAESPLNLATPSLSGRAAPPSRGARGEEGAHSGAPRRLAVFLSSTASGSSGPPGVAEITDPESLLSLGGPKAPAGSTGAAVPGAALSEGTPGDSASLAAPIRTATRARAQALLEVRERATPADGHTRHHTEADVECPASSVRPVNGAIVKLSDNETLARVSNSGVVIRRRKRA
jgi:hypothetical protein